METEKKGTASPKEVEMPRPELYLIVVTELATNEDRVSDGIWLRTSTGAVQVKLVKREPFPDAPANPNRIGSTISHLPRGPKYTGPIDDETMANILIYG